jgi:hypothetical protein
MAAGVDKGHDMSPGWPRQAQRVDPRGRPAGMVVSRIDRPRFTGAAGGRQREQVSVFRCLGRPEPADGSRGSCRS